MVEATFGPSRSPAYPPLHRSCPGFSCTGGQNLVWSYVDSHISLGWH